MELPHVNIVANRDKIISEIDQLRSKITSETEEIIKLKVAQDAAYEELNEKYKQLKSKHERLQQHMLEAQVQHENISWKYQDELRLRPETSNKISSVHETRVALEKNVEQLMEILCQTRSDQAILGEAYNKLGQNFSELTGQVECTKKKHQTESNNLKQEITLREEHALHMSEVYNSLNLDANTTTKELKDKLEKTQIQNMELACTVRDLSKNTDNQQHVLKQKESTILTLQSDLKQLLQEFEAQFNRMQQCLQQKDAEIIELKDSHKGLKKAINKEENLTKSALESGDQLLEMMCHLEVEHEATKSAKSELEIKQIELQVFQETLNLKINSLCEEKQEALRKVADYVQKISSHKEQLKVTEDQVKLLETDKENMMIEMENFKLNVNKKTIVLNNMELENAELLQKCTALEKSLDTCKTHSETVLASLDDTIEKKIQKIGNLITETKKNSDEKAKIELEAQHMRADIKRQREIGKNKDQQIDKMQTYFKGKKFEKAKSARIKSKLRAEKQNLEVKIQDMQQTIDNAQQALKDMNVPRMDHLGSPERDSNFMKSPVRQDTPTVASKRVKRSTLRIPPAAKALPRAVYEIFSDSDDNELDLPTSQTKPVAHLSPNEEMAVKHKKRAEQFKKLKKSEDATSSSK